MLSKSKIKEVIENFPENISIDDFVDRLMLMEKTERGLQQSMDGKGISEDELDLEIEKWFK